jgi:hypothetical protein
VKYIRYLIGFIIGALIAYLIGATVAWDISPGEWGFFWRFWCLLWVILLGHVGGLIVKDKT